MKKNIEKIITYLKEKETFTGDWFDHCFDNDLNDYQKFDDFGAFGIRMHQKGSTVGGKIPNSFEHYDGIGHKEMSSTSCIWISSESCPKKVLADIEDYWESDREIIIIAGDDYGMGLDTHVNERQIANAERIY